MMRMGSQIHLQHVISQNYIKVITADKAEKRSTVLKYSSSLPYCFQNDLRVSNLISTWSRCSSSQRLSNANFSLIGWTD
jgi:hypothetical protein